MHFPPIQKRITPLSSGKARIGLNGASTYNAINLSISSITVSDDGTVALLTRVGSELGNPPTYTKCDQTGVTHREAAFGRQTGVSAS